MVSGDTCTTVRQGWGFTGGAPGGAVTGVVGVGAPSGAALGSARGTGDLGWTRTLREGAPVPVRRPPAAINSAAASMASRTSRSEEHTSELQSRQYLVC